MPVSNAAALAEMQNLFSKQDMLEILEFTLPRIKEAGEELQRLLTDCAWEAAAKIAHQMLSSANSYASSTFEIKLRHISQLQTTVIDSALFQQELQQEFDAIQQNILDFIVNNKMK